MSFHFQELSGDEYRRWFTGNHAYLRQRSPFHHPAWIAASARGVGFQDVYVGMVQGRTLVGALPGYVMRRGPLRLFGSPMKGTMTSYMGPVGLELDQRPEAMVELIARCNDFIRKRWRVQTARFTLRNAPAGGKLDLDSDWAQQRAGSYRLSLEPGVEEVWNGLKSDCRRNIRKARKQGIEIEPLRDVSLFYRMLDETFRRHDTTSFHSEEFFRLLLEGLVPEDRLWPWSARYEGQQIAAGLFLHDDREVHFISGASFPEFGNLPTSYLLHWHAIETATDAGLKIFNSDASRVRSIDRFKESFRPELEKRYTLTWAPAYLYRAQKRLIAGYRYFRGLQARLKTKVEGVRSER